MGSNSAEVPSQKVGAFRRRLDFDDADEATPAVRSRRAIDLLTGVANPGQDVVEGRPPNTPFIFTEAFSGLPMSYVKKAKQLELGPKNAQAFFGELGLVEKFGTSTTFYARLGFDPFSQTMKIYIQKLNSNASPTILGILFREVGVILDQIKSTLAEIDESVKAGAPLFKYEPGTLIEPKELSFWTHDDAWYSETMRFRMRFVNVRRDRYFFYLNSQSDNSKFDGYFGPKLTFCRGDIDGFVKTMQNIIAKVDPEDL